MVSQQQTLCFSTGWLCTWHNFPLLQSWPTNSCWSGTEQWVGLFVFFNYHQAKTNFSLSGGKINAGRGTCATVTKGAACSCCCRAGAEQKAESNSFKAQNFGSSLLDLCSNAILLLRSENKIFPENTSRGRCEFIKTRVVVSIIPCGFRNLNIFLK